MSQGRAKRRSVQLQETVRMKLDLITKQKQDIADIVEDYASEIVSRGRQILTDPTEVDLQHFQHISQKLDKVSDVLTQLTMKLDSFLDDGGSSGSLDRIFEEKEDVLGVKASLEEKSVAPEQEGPETGDLSGDVKAKECTSPLMKDKTSVTSMSNISSNSTLLASSTTVPVSSPTSDSNSAVNTHFASSTTALTQDSIPGLGQSVPDNHPVTLGSSGPSTEHPYHPLVQTSVLGVAGPQPQSQLQPQSSVSPSFSSQPSFFSLPANADLLNDHARTHSPGLPPQPYPHIPQPASVGSRGVVPLLHNSTQQTDMGLLIPSELFQVVPVYRNNVNMIGPNFRQSFIPPQPELQYYMNSPQQLLTNMNSIRESNFPLGYQSQLQYPNLMNLGATQLHQSPYNTSWSQTPHSFNPMITSPSISPLITSPPFVPLLPTRHGSLITELVDSPSQVPASPPVQTSSDQIFHTASSIIPVPCSSVNSQNNTSDTVMLSSSLPPASSQLSQAQLFRVESPTLSSDHSFSGQAGGHLQSSANSEVQQEFLENKHVKSPSEKSSKSSRRSVAPIENLNQPLTKRKSSRKSNGSVTPEDLQKLTQQAEHNSQIEITRGEDRSPLPIAISGTSLVHVPDRLTRGSTRSGRTADQPAQDISKATLSRAQGAQELPPLNVPRLRPEKDEIMVGVISDVEHPWSFHVQLNGFLQIIAAAIREALDTSLTKLTSLQPGVFCLAKFSKDGLYYRAKILSLQEKQGQMRQVKVSYIDYGNRAVVPSSDILRLPETLIKYPAQALLCSLSGASPKNSEHLWTEEAILLFQQCTKGQQVQVRVTHPFNEKSQQLFPHLVDIIVNMPTSSKHTPKDGSYSLRSLAAHLISKGVAKPVEQEDQLAALKRLFTPADSPSHDRLKSLDALISSIKSQSLDKGQAQASQQKQKFSPLPLCFQQMKSKNLKGNLPFPSYIPTETGSVALDTHRSSRGPKSNQKVLNISPQSMEHFQLCQAVDERLHSLGKAMKLAMRKAQRKCDLESLESNSSQESDSEVLSYEYGTESSFSSELKASEETEVEFLVMMSAVISPTSFFIHRVNEESGRTFEQLIQKLTSIFEKHSSSSLSQLSSSFTPKKNSLCCAVFSQDGNFYRGLVLDTGSSPKKASGSETPEGDSDTPRKLLIFFIDYGDFEWVARDKVFPLPDEFKAVTPMVLWCSLLYVQPKNSEYEISDRSRDGGRDRMVWSVDAVDKFRSLVCGEKVFSAVVSEAALQKINDITGFQLEPLPVYLLDRSVDGEEICLNHELIHLGFASLRPTPVPQAASGFPSVLKDWNPMEDDFTSIRNSYKVDPDEAGMALVGYTAGNVGKDGRKVCIYFNRPRGCFRGDRCPNLHIKVDRNGMTYDKVPVMVFEEDQSDVLPEANTMVAVTVSMVMTPGHFYVTLPWGRMTLNEVHDDPERVHAYLKEETLESLMLNMQEYYRHKLLYEGDLTLLAPGQAMAAKVRDQWTRVKVIDTDVERGLVQVMSVDFGNMDWVDEKELRELDMRFIHLTPQAVECSLVDVEPADSQGEWSEETCEQFAEMVRGKILAAWIKYRFPSGRVSIHLYDTSDKSDIDLNQKLVDLGLAIQTVKSPPTTATSQSHVTRHDDVIHDEEKYMPA